MPIYPNFYQTLSACPIVELRGYAAACGLKGRLYAYLDFAGPTGTARDGLAEGMLALAIEKKKLSTGHRRAAGRTKGAAHRCNSGFGGVRCCSAGGRTAHPCGGR